MDHIDAAHATDLFLLSIVKITTVKKRVEERIGSAVLSRERVDAGPLVYQVRGGEM